MDIIINNYSGPIDIDRIYSRFQQFQIACERTIPVSFCADPDEFAEPLGFQPPEWVVAYQNQDGVYVKHPALWDETSNPGSIEQVVTHELAHMVLQGLKDAIPLWIYEGFAMLLAEQVDLGDFWPESGEAAIEGAGAEGAGAEPGLEGDNAGQLAFDSYELDYDPYELDYDPYELDYDSPDLYAAIAQAMAVLSTKVGLTGLVRRILEVDDYWQDPLFGTAAWERRA